MKRFLFFTVFLLCLISSQSVFAQDLEVHFIDVGQGDSILILTPNNKTILIDAGKHEDPESDYNPFIYLEHIGITKLDAVFITHPHEDHFGGLKYICGKDDDNLKMPIAALYYSVKPGPIYGKKFATCMDQLVKGSEDKSQISARGPPLKFGAVEFSVLYPNEPIKKPHPKKNPDSIVMKMTYKNVSFLFTGDTVKKIEKSIEGDLKSTVLKIAHHGADTSSDRKALLNRVAPKYAVIFANDKDYGNSFGHPHEETLRNLKEMKVKLYRTDLSGTIVMKSDGEKITVSEDNRVSQQSPTLWKPGRK